MVANTVKTFSDIYTHVMDILNIPTTYATQLGIVKRAINARYQDVAFSRRWSWLRKRDELRIRGLKEGGTVAVTLGSATVTGTTSVFNTDPVAAADWWFKVTGFDEIYRVSSVASDTSLTLADVYNGATATGKSYVLWKDSYALPTDCMEVENVWHEHFSSPMWPVSLEQLRIIQSSFPGDENKGVVFWLTEPDSSEVRNITIFPKPDKDYLLHFDYIRQITALDADADEPLIPLEHRHVLVYGALADMYRVLNDETNAQMSELQYGAMVVRMAGDTENTDSMPRFVVPDMWGRGRVVNTQPLVTDTRLTSLFDKYRRLLYGY